MITTNGKHQRPFHSKARPYRPICRAHAHTTRASHPNALSGPLHCKIISQVSDYEMFQIAKMTSRISGSPLIMTIRRYRQCIRKLIIASYLIVKLWTRLHCRISKREATVLSAIFYLMRLRIVAVARRYRRQRRNAVRFCLLLYLWLHFIISEILGGWPKCPQYVYHLLIHKELNAIEWPTLT